MRIGVLTVLVGAMMACGGSSTGGSTTGHQVTDGATGSTAATAGGSTSGTTESSTSTTSTTTNTSSTGTSSTSTTGTTASSTTSTTTGTTTSTTTGTTGTSGGCGTCPSGYTCGSANGIPVCRAPSGIPRFSHVFVIPMENTSWSTLDAANNTPYLHGLKTSGAYATDYHGVAHPSLPNYIAMISGDNQGIGCDCQPTGTTSCGTFNCNLLIGSCSCGQTADTIADDIEAAGENWRAYGENMGSPCNTSDGTGYAVRHVPFLYFSGIATNATRCNDHVVDYSGFAADLAAGPRDFNFLTPNLTDDMHDPSYPQNGPQNLANGDTWLGQQVPAILASQAYQDGSLVVIVWDEDDDSGGITGTDDPIGMYILSPYAKTGYASTVHADHYSLLATIEDGLGLPRLGNAATATPLADFFPAH